jgi:hypothetical protein
VPEDNKLKLAEQALAAHRAKLATATNRDQVRRQIAAAQRKIDDLRKGQTTAEPTT